MLRGTIQVCLCIADLTVGHTKVSYKRTYEIYMIVLNEFNFKKFLDNYLFFGMFK